MKYKMYHQTSEDSLDISGVGVSKNILPVEYTFH